MKKLLLSGGAVVATVALSGSLAFAQTITGTGHKSVNVISNNTIMVCKSKNTNNVGVNTVTQQGSSTGNAKNKNNTNGGNASTGDSKNTNATTATLNVTNSSACGGGLLGTTEDTTGDPSISNTGSKSVNVIGSLNFSSNSTTNKNGVWVTTETLQGSSSGDATVSGNTLGGGDASTGNSGSDNATTLTLTVSND